MKSVTRRLYLYAAIRFQVTKSRTQSETGADELASHSMPTDGCKLNFHHQLEKRYENLLHKPAATSSYFIAVTDGVVINSNGAEFLFNICKSAEVLSMCCAIFLFKESFELTMSFSGCNPAIALK